jgi:hypothetical protein
MIIYVSFASERTQNDILAEVVTHVQGPQAKAQAKPSSARAVMCG